MSNQTKTATATETAVIPGTEIAATQTMNQEIVAYNKIDAAEKK
jgi:hypothetical protein